MFVRLLSLVVAALVAVDAFMPGVPQTLRVDQHVAAPTRQPGDRFWQTGYTLRFAGGRPGSCAVGYAVYDALADGDEVAVTRSRVLRSCIAIRRGDEAILAPRVRVEMLVAIAVLLFIAWRGLPDGWRGDEDRDRPGISFGP